MVKALCLGKPPPPAKESLLSGGAGLWASPEGWGTGDSLTQKLSHSRIWFSGLGGGINNPQDGDPINKKRQRPEAYFCTPPHPPPREFQNLWFRFDLLERQPLRCIRGRGGGRGRHQSSDVAGMGWGDWAPATPPAEAKQSRAQGQQVGDGGSGVWCSGRKGGAFPGPPRARSQVPPSRYFTSRRGPLPSPHRSLPTSTNQAPTRSCCFHCKRPLSLHAPPLTALWNILPATFYWNTCHKTLWGARAFGRFALAPAALSPLLMENVFSLPSWLRPPTPLPWALVWPQPAAGRGNVGGQVPAPAPSCGGRAWGVRGWSGKKGVAQGVSQKSVDSF